CEGTNLNLTASTVSGATYYWTGPNGFTSTTQNPTRTNATLTMAGNYNVVAIVGSCTSSVASTNVTVNAAPTASTPGSNSPVCEGTNLNLTASTVSGATYYWTGPNGFTSTTQNPTRTNATLTMAGNYNVVTIVGSCTSSVASTNVTFKNASIISLFTTNVLQKEATINWTLSQTADSVRVFYKMQSSNHWGKIITLIGQNFLYQNTLTPGKTFEYKIETYANGCMDSSAIQTFETLPPCGIASNFTTTNIQTTQAKLSWIKSENPDSFVIWYRKSGNNNLVWIKVNVGIDTSRVITGLTNQTNYEWKLVAHCGASNFYAYPVQNFETPAPCGTVINLNVTDITSNRVKLWWDTIPGSTYQIAWRVINTVNWWNRTNVQGSPVFHASNLAPNTTYEWRVRSICNGENDQWSVLDTFTTGSLKDPIAHNDNSFSIYPNPTQGQFIARISAETGVRYSCKIISINGQEITQREGIIDSKPVDFAFDISDNAKGVYFLYLSIGEDVYIEKIVLK
ncbi:MAG: fibronectin type III domain-containing protein, partial [Bacteroidia bacterium]|nr:fibronectin type III domain-containing protein [Bacteroidia bacterium]